MVLTEQEAGSTQGEGCEKNISDDVTCTQDARDIDLDLNNIKTSAASKDGFANQGFFEDVRDSRPDEKSVNQQNLNETKTTTATAEVVHFNNNQKSAKLAESENSSQKPSNDVTKNPETNGGRDIVDLDDVRFGKGFVMKNVILISLAFMCTYTSYTGLAKLQSSLHRVEGMGVIAQCVAFSSLTISCLFVPKPLIGVLGHKWAMTVSFGGHFLWMLANGYAVWATMIPASILVGLCEAPLWTSQMSYLTLAAVRYAALSGEKEDAVMTRFFGIFFTFFQLSGVIGSVISSTVLQQPAGNMTSEDDIKAYCGMNDCPENNYTSSNWEVSDKTVWTLVGIYFMIAIMAVVIAGIFVDQLPDDKKRQKRKPSAKEIGNNVMATIRHMKKPNQLLLMPVTVFSGMAITFFSAEYTKSFITCIAGIWMVGLITIPFNIVNGAISFLTGIMSKYIGRAPIFLSGVVVQIGVMLSLFLWEPSSDEIYFLYIISCLWGYCEAVWGTQVYGLYGAAFATESEAGFSNCVLWESLGFALAYSYSAFICTSTKAYILISFMTVGTIGFVICDYNVRHSKVTVEDVDVKGKDMESQPSIECYDNDIIKTAL